MTAKNAKRKGIGKSQVFRVAMVTLLVLVLTGLVSGIGLFIYAARDLPEFDPARLSGAETTLIYDDKENLVGGLHAGENRTEVTLDKVPQDLINAFLSVEDKDFYEHHGIDMKGIVRAVVRNLQSGDLTGQGGSTITQQLARTAFLSFDKRWERKVKEIVLAIKIESMYSKDEIMTMYLNKINFGSGAYGVQAAANTYFGKNVDELNLAECTLLAGLPNGPEYYNPFRHYERAKARQKDVINSMVNSGFISKETAEKTYAAELLFRKGSNTGGNQYGFYIDAIIEEALDILDDLQIYNDSETALYRSGLKIYTAMDSGLQAHAEKFYSDPANFLQQKSSSGENVQAAMAVIDVNNGQVKTVMGGKNYERKRGFNRATSAYRQPGSAIKPITVYTTALELGYMPFLALDDSPISFKLHNTVWSPKNYDLKYRGIISMRTAVQHSVNTYAVQLLDLVGIRNSFDHGKAMGLELIDSPGTNDLGLAPLALGGLTKGATPVQMAAAYAAIANGGIYTEPFFILKIVDANGTEIYSHEPEYRRVISAQTAWLMSSMLQTVVNSGTGTNAKIPGVVTAGKTGTSEEYRDSWFCGFTPAYSAAVWMGYDQKDTMRNYPPQYPGETAYGGNFPARMFRGVLSYAHQDFKPSPRSMPGGIVSINVCSVSGKIPGDICPEDKIISEFCVQDKVPTESCDRHQLVTICTESGKLAGRFCPYTEVRAMVAADEGSVTPDKVPTATCDIHADFDFNGIFQDEVFICTDSRHGGKLYRANLPGPAETGGCPEDQRKRYILQPGEKLEPCPLEDHKTKRNKPGRVFDKIVGDND